MKTVEEVEKAVTQLPADQLREFRAWYEKFDAEIWDKSSTSALMGRMKMSHQDEVLDKQIEQDILAGKLDKLAEAAIADHKSGKSKKL